MSHDESRPWWRSSEFKVALVTGLVTAAVGAVVTFVAAPDDPPEVVTYKVKYVNRTDSQQDNVVVQAGIPGSSEYVMGSTYLSTSKTDNQWASVGDGITGRGLNIGSYAPDGGAYLKFKVRPTGRTTFTCSSNGEAGSISISASDELKIWVTC